MPGGDPLAAAVTKLTEIASHLTLERKKSRTLESILEGAGSAGMSETTGSSSSRRQAAALRALRSALQKQPEAISKAIEKNMEEDFGKAIQMPGSSAINVSARAWLELRARVQGYQTPVRFLWAVAGVLNAIRAERHQEARARCGLILAMGDQMSIDRGSWVVAGEIGLEDPPPMASFNSHTLPSEAEPPYTKLIDGRWMELILSKLSDVDSLKEKKKKLAGRRATTTTTSETELPKPNPKRKGGGKGDKGKSAESVMETFPSGDGKVGVAAGGTASSTSPLPHPNGGNHGVVSDELAPPKTNAPRAPGAVQVEHVWDPLCRWVLSSRRSQSLSSFCHSTFSRQIHQANHPDTRPVWPIPMPYPNLAAEGTSREQSFQRAINMMVITLNWLHLGGPRRIPSDFYSRARLTPEQLGIVSRLRRLAQEWNESGPIQAEDMGRSAGKIESLEATVQQLTAAAIRLASSGGPQRQGSGFKKTEKKDPKSTLLGEVQLAKEVECDRLPFKGVPSFNPAPFLESEARRMYEDPLADALPPEEALQAPPHVQVRGSYKEILKLCRKLDDSSRLALLDPALVRPGREAGLFSLMKSVTADRMILDSRPANELEVGLTEWTATMASTCPLLDLVIPAGYQAVAAGEDLRDYYYFFRVTGRRSLRNAIKFRIPLSEARKLRAYAAAPPGLDHYVAGLQTMAMGDLNAVEIGQQSHVKLAISAGVCLEDLLTLRGRLPRSGPYVGIVIDDFIVVECIPSDLPEPQGLLSSRIADRMVETYDAVGLLSHDKKRFRAERRAQFWGSSFDGVAGTLRMQLEKVIPIALITAQVARLGMANRKLLEVLCGSWVAILQCRRRAMCLIDSAFAEIQSNDYHVNFHLAPATIDELWSLVILAPPFRCGP